MINHISINGILCDIEDQNNIVRKIKVIRSYKSDSGLYEEDIFPCMMWSKHNKNSLFSYKSGSLVSIDGRIENVDGTMTIVIESLTLLCGNYVDYHFRAV